MLLLLLLLLAAEEKVMGTDVTGFVTAALHMAAGHTHDGNL
jgi:hypothetical protein